MRLAGWPGGERDGDRARQEEDKKNEDAENLAVGREHAEGNPGKEVM